MRLRAQKGVCVLGGFLDGLTKVGRNGQKASVDRKGATIQLNGLMN